MLPWSKSGCRLMEDTLHDQLDLEYRRIQRQLASFLFRLTASREEAEDLVQETFTKAVEKVRQFRGESTLKTYLFSIASNLAYDHLKERKRWGADAQDRARTIAESRPEVEAELNRIHRESPAGAYEFTEHIDFCFTCVSRVLRLDRQISVLLKEIYGFSDGEIALILGKSESVIKHHLHDARRDLREIFEGRCALVGKQGPCWQCSELNGYFNGKQAEAERKRVAESEKKSSDLDHLLNLRLEMIRQIDPLNARGSDLHDYFMRMTRSGMENTPL